MTEWFHRFQSTTVKYWFLLAIFGLILCHTSNLLEKLHRKWGRRLWPICKITIFSMTGEKSLYMLNGLVCFPREPVVKLLFLVTSPTITFNMSESWHSKQRIRKSRDWRKFGNGLLRINYFLLCVHFVVKTLNLEISRYHQRIVLKGVPQDYFLFVSQLIRSLSSSAVVMVSTLLT